MSEVNVTAVKEDVCSCDTSSCADAANDPTSKRRKLLVKNNASTYNYAENNKSTTHHSIGSGDGGTSLAVSVLTEKDDGNLLCVHNVGYIPCDEPKPPSPILSYSAKKLNSSGCQSSDGDCFSSAFSPLPVILSAPVKENIYDQDTDDEALCGLPAAYPCPVVSTLVKQEIDIDSDGETSSHLQVDAGPPSPVMSVMKNFAEKSTQDKNANAKQKQSQRKRKRAETETEILECYNCSTFKRREKFSTKQWQRGITQQKRKLYCRRCEEKILVKQQVGPSLLKLGVRIHIKTSHKSKAKFLSVVIPMNTKLAFLPSELTLDGYTREPWSLNDNEFESIWQTTTLRCLVGEEKMVRFIDFLKERKKSAYGTFSLKDGTDGFFFVPFCQPHQAKHISACKNASSKTVLVCKFILGLGLTGTGKESSKDEETEDYISPSILGSLLFAQSRTENSLTIVPKGSVKPAPKLQSSPSRPKNAVSRDWYGHKMFVKEEGIEESKKKG